MRLGPDIEALLQGALDNTLTPEERETLDRLMTENIEVKGRAAHLKQLAELLDSLGAAEPPATLVQDVLGTISQQAHRHSIDSPSAIEPRGRVQTFPGASARSIHPSALRGDIVMNKRIVWGLAAAAVLVIVVMRLAGYPPVSEGTEATIGTAQRYQAPQIEAKDVAVGDTSVQALMQTETWDAIMKDETLRTLLQDASFRRELQERDLREVLAQADIHRAMRDPEFGKRLSDVALLRALEDPELSQKLSSPEMTKKLLGDPGLARGLNDENLRVALRHQAFVNALRKTEIRAQLMDAKVAAALASPAFQMAIRDNGFAAALRHTQFAAELASGLSLAR